jgi:hypothetical protein
MVVNVAQVNEEAESRLTRSLNLERLHAKAQPYDSPLHEASQKKVPRLKSFIFFPVSNLSIMLYLVGLGLADEKDITVKGLEIVKKAERVYLEAYTAILLVEKEQLVYSFKSQHFIS